MLDKDYEDALLKMKLHFADELKKCIGKFSISNGELWYVGYTVPDMLKLQKYINELLGQKVYKADYIGYNRVYARNEKEAEEFFKQENDPKIFITKITETTDEIII